MEEVGAVLPKPHEFPAVEIVEMVIRGFRVVKPNNLYKPRAWQWANMKQANNNILSKILDIEKNFNLLK